jgi:MinD-like ATPase involved in chromosome partitioning or flagellar assembly
VATEDRDKPADVADAADAAPGPRDDPVAGRPVPSEDELNGNANGAGGGPGAVRGSSDRDDDPDDYEPYLPPGPNPFSSVHPQGSPSPYRTVGNGEYPPPFDRGPWPPERPSAPPEPAPGREPAGSADGGEPREPDEPDEPPTLPPSSESRPAVSPYPPLPDDEPAGGQPGATGYGGPSPYPSYTPYGPDEEIADDALTDYGLPSPQSYGYAPPPPRAEPLPDTGVPEPRFSPTAPSGPPVPAYRDPGPPNDEFSDHDFQDQEFGDRNFPSRNFPAEGPDRAFPAEGYATEGYPNRNVPAEEYRDGDYRFGDPLTGDDRTDEPGLGGRRDEPGLGGRRDELGLDSRRDELGLGTGPYRAASGDAALRDAPPPSGPPQPGTAPPPVNATPATGLPVTGLPLTGPPGAGRSGLAPGRDPAAAPPLGRPPVPERPQPGFTPLGPPPGADPRGPVPGLNGPGGLPPQPGLEEDEYGPGPDGGSGPETSDSLTAEALLHGKRTAPGSGWRRTVYRATGGLVRVGESAGMQRRRELVWRARTPVAGGHHRVAVMSLKGGVGKTTTTVGLGATLATLRGDRVIAVDANPDRGTLSDKVRLETAATVRDLLNERQQVHRYADVRAFTSQASSRLEVLASDRDPGVSVAFSDADYRDVARVLEHYYSICITDCGTGLLHSAMGGVLALADQIVVVSSPSVDGARSASATLDWLDAHGYSDLVRNAVVVLSTVRPRSKSTVDLDRLEQHFAARCRDVVRVPYDPHLEEGAEVELEQLSAATTEAYLRLAATVGDGFAWPRRTVNRGANA